MDRDMLARRVRETAYLEGEFTLRSGRKSNYYLDKYLFETQPDVLAGLGQAFAERIDPRVTRIAGPELGAVTLAAATSLASGLPFVIVRKRTKDYGTANRFEGKVAPGDVVLLVEDVVTTGGAVLEAANALRDAGVTVDRIIAVIDRDEGGRQAIETAGFRFESLLTKADLGIK